MATDSQIEVADKQELESDSEQTRPGPVYVPAVDIFEDDDGIVVVADVPGASSDGVEVDLDSGTLTIGAQVADPRQEEESDIVREWDSGRYYRQFSLSDQIDQNRIEASLTDGVLRVRLPKVEQAKPRKIEVKAG